MAITIAKVDFGYLAIVTPHHGHDSNWKTASPMTSEQLTQELLSLGCHQTDIGDAFYEADPYWLDRKKS